MFTADLKQNGDRYKGRNTHNFGVISNGISSKLEKTWRATVVSGEIGGVPWSLGNKGGQSALLSYTNDP